mgnify:CR=1 FL=1
MTDPISDMLTRIRNACQAKHVKVEIPASNVKKEIARILLEQKYINNFVVIDDNKQGIIKVYLKYGPTGESVITTGGNMATGHVIHTPGPVWNGGNRNEEQLLRNSYYNCLNLAKENGIKSISFPSISTGVYRFPIDKAARIALTTVKEFIQEHNLEEVRFVLFSERDLKVYEEALKD